MKIIIAGDGDTGCHLARQLCAENQDVVLIGEDRKRLEELDSRNNIMVQYGSGVLPSTLKSADVARCDLFIGVTPWGNENIVSSQLAKALGAGRTVARIDNGELFADDMLDVLHHTGIDIPLYPEYLVANEIRTLLKHNWVKQWFELHDGALVIAGVKVRPESELAGRYLHELMKTEHPLHVAAIRSKGHTIIPKGDNRIEANDIIYLSMLPNVADKVAAMCGHRPSRVQRVMISGAGKLTRQIVAALQQSDYTITVIDADTARCRKLSALYPSITVVNSDQRDYEVLCDEGLRVTDAFIAVNDSSEMNIVGAMLAKDAGVPRTIAEIEDIQYFTEAENLNIGVVVNKKLLTSSTILQMLLDTKNMETSRCLSLEDADVSEMVVAPGSGITRHAVRDLKLPAGITLAGLVRDGEGMLVSGDTHILPGDHVVVFSLSGSLNKYEKLFK